MTHDDETALRDACARLEASGEAMSKIAGALAQLGNKAEARRVLVAAGLMTGVYDVSADWRIIERAKGAESDG